MKLSQDLVALWADGCPPAAALLRRVFPPGLLRFLSLSRPAAAGAPASAARPRPQPQAQIRQQPSGATASTGASAMMGSSSGSGAVSGSSGQQQQGQRPGGGPADRGATSAAADPLRSGGGAPNGGINSPRGSDGAPQQAGAPRRTGGSLDGVMRPQPQHRPHSAGLIWKCALLAQPCSSCPCAALTVQSPVWHAFQFEGSIWHPEVGDLTTKSRACIPAAIVTSRSCCGNRRSARQLGGNVGRGRAGPPPRGPHLERDHARRAAAGAPGVRPCFAAVIRHCLGGPVVLLGSGMADVPVDCSCISQGVHPCLALCSDQHQHEPL